MNAVEVRKLAKQFGSFQAVENISFTVRPGEAFALLGPNGSGKTTTLKAIAGLTPPSSGQVLVEGIDVWKEPREAKRRFSYLPQRVAFPENLTAREVLEFCCRLRHLPARRAAEALALAGLDGPECARKAVGAFSDGMSQRLGIAVALLPASGILILDEPTASLDPEGAATFLATVEDLKRGGTTVVFSSHVLSDVEALADRVALLIDGRLVAVDAVEDLNDEWRRHAPGRGLLQELYIRYIHEKRADHCDRDTRRMRQPAAATH
jgi:Cu-processing system ATP-binding protein